MQVSFLARAGVRHILTSGVLSEIQCAWVSKVVHVVLKSPCHLVITAAHVIEIEGCSTAGHSNAEHLVSFHKCLCCPSPLLLARS